MSTVITKETAAKIWNAHREIGAAENLLKELAEHKKHHTDPTPMDAFRRRSGFQIGVPSGNRTSALYDVDPDLVPHIVRGHIAKKEKELIVACELARMELDGIVEPQTSTGDSSTSGNNLPTAQI